MKLKKKLTLLGTSALLSGAAAHADLEAMAFSEVAVIVDPNISIASLQQFVTASSSVQTGVFSITVPFRVDANQQFVDLSCASSELFKANDPTGTEVAPIPLTGLCVIDAENANPVAFQSNQVLLTNEGPPIPTPRGTFSTSQSDFLTFESSQSGHFSQNVSITVFWNQNDPEKPVGEYSGAVKLLGMVGDSGAIEPAS